MPYFFYGIKIIHSFSPETKKRHQISLDGHQTKAIPIFNVVDFYSLSFEKKRVRNRPPPRFAKIVLCLFEIIDQKLRLIPGTFF